MSAERLGGNATTVHIHSAGNSADPPHRPVVMLAVCGSCQFDLHRGQRLQVYEGGSLYDTKVLDIKDDDLMDTVTAAITRVAAASLELNYPTLASIPHSVINGYKNVLAVSVATDYDFPLAEKVRHMRRVVWAFWWWYDGVLGAGYPLQGF